MRRSNRSWVLTLCLVLTVSLGLDIFGQPPGQAPHETTHQTESPPLPNDMSLEKALEYGEKLPPSGFPSPVPDNEIFTFSLFEQLEYAVQEEEENEFRWAAQGWTGFDYDKLWWKTEGTANFDETDEGDFDFDLLYSRLVTPFWNLQVGVQYASEWEGSDYSDLWSGAVALQGLAPGMVEVDASLYLSEKSDLTAEVELEYNLLITQRLVLQPRVEFGFSAQDVPERLLGAGLTESRLDLRLRYEIERELAPYVGVSYEFSVDKTARLIEDAGGQTELLSFVAGVRIAF